MRIQHFAGRNNIPVGCRSLVLSYGLMQHWLRQNDIQASVIFDNEQPVSWSAFIPAYPDHSIIPDEFNIGVFTARDHRGNGLGKLVMRHALYFIAMINPHAVVRYGSNYCYAFNNTYNTEIVRLGLTPDHCY
jgi:GNAT superfamily N-acetyltransferase